MSIFLAVVFGLISMVAYGAASAFLKTLTQKHSAAAVIFLRGISVVASLAILAIPSYASINNVTYAGLAILLGAVGYLPILAFANAVKNSSLGIVAPIAGSSPLITLVLSAIFIGIGLHTGQWIAAVLIIVANIAMSLNISELKNKKFELAQGVPFAMLAAIGWGLFYFLLVPVSRELNPWIAALFVEIGVTSAAGLHVLLRKERVSLPDSWTKPFVLNGLCLSAGTLAFTYGVTHYNVGIIAALSNSTAAVTALLGVLVFKEVLTKRDRIATAVIVAGIAGLSIF